MARISNKFEVVDKCPVCLGTSGSKKFMVRDRLIIRPDSFSLVRCLDCGLYYLSKRPTKDNIKLYYPDVYEPYNINKHDFYVDLQERLMKAYFKRGKSTVDSLMGLLYTRIYGDFPVLNKNNPRVLDIGCGNGLFINSLKKNGWDVYGIDISEKSVNFARNTLNLKNVKQGDVENISYPKSFFDVIVMNHVIEHVYDPNKLFLNASKILKPDGIMIVTTPNIRSINFSIFGQDWFPLETPRHLTLFSPQSMTKLAKNSGLKIVKIFSDKSSHALQRSIKYRFGVDVSILKLFLLPFTFIFALLNRSDIATYRLVKHTHLSKSPR